jgi:low temperature requirement protein LtrA
VITQLSTTLRHDHSWVGLVRAFIVFVPIYTLWVGTALQTNRTDVDRPGDRVRLFVVALAAIFMAIALGDAYGNLGLVLAIAYCCGRLVLLVPQLTTIHDVGLPVNGYTVGMFITGPLLVVGGCFHGDARALVWGLAALVELAAPTLLRLHLRSLHLDAAHLTERFVLFVLVAIGESIVAVGRSTPFGELSIGQGFAVGAAFVLSCGLWWVYFHFATNAMRHSLATARVQIDIVRLVLSYGHLSFIGAIVLVAVGMHSSVADPGEQLGWPIAAMLCGGTALYLATFAFTRWAMFRLVSWTRLSATAVTLALIPIAPSVPAIASVSALAIVITVLNVGEWLLSRRLGWTDVMAKAVR